MQASNPSTISISKAKVGRVFGFLRIRIRKFLQEKATKTIVVIAKRVDYDRDPIEVLRACGFAPHIIGKVARSMPRRCKGVVENVPVVFYRLGRPVDMEESDKTEEARNLIPDPYALAAVIEENRFFADNYPCYCQWGRNGQVASLLAFGRYLVGGRIVDCDRLKCTWNCAWWRSGVSKNLCP